MINGFEKRTSELNDYEAGVILPAVVLILRNRIGKAQAITNKNIVHTLGANGMSTNGPRMRKIIHEIRISGMVERLVATSAGYYVTDDNTELEKYVESLHQRAESIMEIAKQLEFQRKKKMDPIVERQESQRSLFDSFGK